MGKIQAVRVGSEARVPRAEIERLLGQTAEVVLTSGDRLTRFGTEYLETLFSSFGVALTVLDPGEDQTPEQEVTEDLLSIIASFAGKLSGMRLQKQKELLKCAENVLHSL